MAQALGGIAEAYARRLASQLRTGIVSVAEIETCAILAFGPVHSRCADPCTRDRDRPEGGLFAVGRPDQADGLDADHHDVA